MHHVPPRPHAADALVGDIIIRAIVFDIGGVLRFWSDARHRKFISRSLGISAEEYDAAVRALEPRWQRGRLTDRQVFKILGNRFHLKPEKIARAEREVSGIHKTNRPVLKLALRLKKDYRVGILTNAQPAHKLSNRDIYRLFPLVICSCDVGHVKPQKAIYKLLLKRLRLPASQVVFIDDKPTNVAAAKKLGIHAIRFKNLSQLKKDLTRHGIKFS